MSSVQLTLGEDLSALLRQVNEPIERAALELIVFELYRRAILSSGKAAELLGMERIAFIKEASRLGIPYIDMTAEELDDEIARIKAR